MVHGGVCHDRCQYLWRDLRLRAWYGGSQSDGLLADGAGFRGRTVGHRLRAYASILQVATHFHLSVPGGPFGEGRLSFGRLDVLHQQDAGSLCSSLRGVPDDATPYLYTFRTPLCAECLGDDDRSVALYLPRRREVAYLDRFTENTLLTTVALPLHLVHRQGSELLCRGCVSEYHGQRMESHLLLRQS